MAGEEYRVAAGKGHGGIEHLPARPFPKGTVKLMKLL
jgi:hypothetical protein